ncbi:unnamed protein product [Ectocarpus sp. CCAP 1310/34]|nr:unnamed protein product [Ectocarpus sp. CCAP 1310/34]
MTALFDISALAAHTRSGASSLDFRSSAVHGPEQDSAVTDAASAADSGSAGEGNRGDSSVVQVRLFGLGSAVMVGVRKGETGVARDRVAAAAPLALAETEGGRVGGWGRVLAFKEERDGREGRWFPWFSRRRRRPPFLPEDGNGRRPQSLMFGLDALRLCFFRTSLRGG